MLPYRDWTVIECPDVTINAERLHACVKQTEDTRQLGVLLCLFDKYMHAVAAVDAGMDHKDRVHLSEAPFSGLIPEDWINGARTNLSRLVLTTIRLKATLDGAIVRRVNFLYRRCMREAGRPDCRWLPHLECLRRLRTQSMKRYVNTLEFVEVELSSMARGTFVPETQLCGKPMFGYEEALAA